MRQDVNDFRGRVGADASYPEPEPAPDRRRPAEAALSPERPYRLAHGFEAHRAAMRVVMAGDQPIWHEALAEILHGRFGEVQSIVAMSIEETIQAVKRSEPALVLVDLSVEGVRGKFDVEAIVQAAKSAPVIVIDARLAESQARRALAAGAKGYVTKTSSRELIGAAINLVVAGGVYFPQLSSEPGASDSPADWPKRLTKRQRAVLALIMQGRTNQEIADALAIALPTVKLHVRAILKAAGARSRTQVVLLGLCETPPRPGVAQSRGF
jgi:DNA-binding NarL/FixJ family response regulator